MIAKLRKLWSDHKIVMSIFMVATIATLFFTIRFVAGVVYWMDPDHRNQALEPWMTPRYVARSYHVPPPVIAQALGLPEKPPQERLTLADIQRATGSSLDQMESAVQQAVTAHMAEPK